ncbi:hypothetical protein [Streptomyces hygroscopicus]|uniref:hypothetical protein n=1 Tax=Streptomyces hygroscopicus TaxID=1912 RepID=UPI0004C880C2|nr:hypothetical protein [Streptomyces hygroscopicus]
MPLIEPTSTWGEERGRAGAGRSPRTHGVLGHREGREQFATMVLARAPADGPLRQPRYARGQDAVAPGAAADFGGDHIAGHHRPDSAHLAHRPALARRHGGGSCAARPGRFRRGGLPEAGAGCRWPPFGIVGLAPVRPGC